MRFFTLFVVAAAAVSAAPMVPSSVKINAGSPNASIAHAVVEVAKKACKASESCMKTFDGFVQWLVDQSEKVEMADITDKIAELKNNVAQEAEEPSFLENLGKVVGDAMGGVMA